MTTSMPAASGHGISFDWKWFAVNVTLCSGSSRRDSEDRPLEWAGMSRQRHCGHAQSRSNSLIDVFARVFASTRFTITAQ